MSTTTDPLADFKSRLETALLATLHEQPAERADRAAAPPRRGRQRVAIALAGLIALVIATVTLGPAMLAPKRPGAAAFAVQPLADGKIQVKLNGSLERPQVRQELARALYKYGIRVEYLLIPGPERLAGRVLSKDHTQPLSEFTYDRAQLGPGRDQVPGIVNITVYIAVG
jgi:hypothetical protein